MKILPKTRKIVKTIYIKLDDFREEKLEDFLSNDILKRWDEFKNVDDLRRSINLAIINAVGAYASSQGLPALSNDVKQKIADEAVKILLSLNYIQRAPKGGSSHITFTKSKIQVITLVKTQNPLKKYLVKLLKEAILNE